MKVSRESLYNMISLGCDMHLIFHDHKIELIDNELNSLGYVASSCDYHLDKEEANIYHPSQYCSIFFKGYHYMQFHDDVFRMGKNGLVFVGHLPNMDSMCYVFNFIIINDSLYVTNKQEMF